jgi:hypothetical protein
MTPPDPTPITQRGGLPAAANDKSAAHGPQALRLQKLFCFSGETAQVIAALGWGLR